MGIEIFKKHLREKRAIKVLCKTDNFNLKQIAKVCRATQKGHASAIDIGTNIDAYKLAKKYTRLPIFVSSVEPMAISKMLKYDIDAIQIGDYVPIYKKNKELKYQEVKDLILEIMSMISDKDIYTCVTIPSTLTMEEQIKLAYELEIMGADLIQTEGYEKVNKKEGLYLVSNPLVSINSTIELLKTSTLPIMTSSCLTDEAINLAFNQGCNAICLDSISDIENEVNMTAKIMQTVGLVAYRNSINKEIPRYNRQLSGI